MNAGMQESPPLDLTGGNRHGRLHNSVDAGESPIGVPDRRRIELQSKVLDDASAHKIIRRGLRTDPRREDGWRRSCRVQARDIKEALRRVNLLPWASIQTRVVLKTCIGDLLEVEQLFPHRPTIGIVQDGIDIRDRVRVLRSRRSVGPVATYDQHARSSTGNLHRRRAVPVRVIPERPRRMIRRNVDLVREAGLRGNIEQYVVAVPCRRYMQTVRVEVNGIEAAYPGRHAQA